MTVIADRLGQNDRCIALAASDFENVIARANAPKVGEHHSVRQLGLRGMYLTFRYLFKL
jgi:hypothetical protein